MQKPKKTCFVISPIGIEGSDTRKMADDFLELLIEPAIQPFGFEIIRADKIATSSVITSDVVQYVQSADICVINLTTHNPNVFYECGRRHENGRPFIQLIRKGDELPFDVAGIRTISYDLSSPRSTLNSIQEIQAYIGNLEKGDFEAGATGESLSSIADGIRRIERMVAKYESLSGAKSGVTQTPTVELKDVLTQHPIGAFNEALDSGNVDLAIQLLPRIRRLIGEKEWLQGATLLAQMGEPVGEDALIEGLQTPDRFGRDLLESLFYSLRKYYYIRNLNQRGVESISRLIDELPRKIELSNKDKATVLNQLALFKYEITDNEGALNTSLEVLDLDQTIPSYFSNIAQCYIAMERFDEAVEYVDLLIGMADLNEGHLEVARIVYEHVRRLEDVKKVDVMISEACEKSDAT